MCEMKLSTKHTNFRHTWIVLLHNLVKCKRSKMTNRSQITVKSCHIKISYTFNHLLTLSQNMFKISSLNLHTSSQMLVPPVNCCESSSFFSRPVLSHSQPTSLSGFCSRLHQSSYQHIKQPRHQPRGLHYLWHTSPVCSRC